MAREEAMVVEEFNKILISHLKDIMLALPALVPQSKEDEKLFKEGIATIDKMVYDLEHCENVRELSRFLDVQRIASEFDMESIKTLDQRIRTSARNSIIKLDEMVEQMRDDDNE